MWFSKISTPVGNLSLVANEVALIAVLFDEHKNAHRDPLWQENGNHPILLQAAIELQEYFEGKRKKFQIPLETKGTAFQKEVWDQLQRIPYGETSTYATIAKVIQRPRAVRAVGTANGLNLLSIIIPCHRVIASNGTLAGYAGGLERKQKLLTFEQLHA